MAIEKRDLVLFGYSGHAYVVIDVAHSMNFKVGAYLNAVEVTQNPYGLSYLGFEDSLDWSRFDADSFVFPAIGSNGARKNIVAFYRKQNLNECTLIDASSTVSTTAKIGKSTLVGPKAIINACAVIGDGCIINSGAIVEHECEIGDFSHIAPGAVLAGNVKVGNSSFIGANSVIKQGVVIGDNVMVGAGSVVIRDISDNETWVGNPARKLK